MSFLYKAEPARGEQWARFFAQKAPDIPFRLWPDIGDAASVRYLAAWQPPENPTSTLPNLEVYCARMKDRYFRNEPVNR